MSSSTADTRKPPRPKPAPSTRSERPASKEPPREGAPKLQLYVDDRAGSKKSDKKRSERKKPVSKQDHGTAEVKPEEQAKKPSDVSARDQAESSVSKETSEKGAKKSRKRKRRSESRPAEPRPEVASAETVRPEAEPAIEVRGEPKRKKRRKKAREPQREPAETRADELVESAPTGPESVAESRGEPKRKKKRKKAHDAERKSDELPSSKPEAEVTAAGAAPEETEAATLPKRKKRKKAKGTDREPERERKSLPPFGDMVLSDDILEALADAGYQDPTPVQAGVIPKALEGRDLMGQAQTGTGKTAAFGIPLLEKFAGREKRKETASLILVPTRELAVQVRDELTKLAGRSKVTAVAVYGGKPIRGQIEHLRRGAEIVVGTPGRVIDLIDRRALNLAALEVVVLDEADRMLDIGFRPDIEKILRRCPQSRQTLLLSATIPPPVKRLAERYMYEPEMLDFSPQDVAVETIEQFYFTVDPRQKFDLLMKLIEREDPKQAIVFCRTKKGTDRVGTRLGRKLTGAAVIHGDLQQRQRDRVMSDFRAGKVRFLVATDVVGRGIDVSSISHIINFDIPEFCDDYVHRVGRTGRMGREGVAYTFVSPEEGNELTRIEMRINRLLVRDEIPGFLAIPKPEPSEEPEKPDPEASKPKPVFGKRTRRIRRAL